MLPEITFTEKLIIADDAQDPATTPLFIGYTRKPLPENRPINLTSLTQAEEWIDEDTTLIWALRHFFDNRGISCYLLSLGCSVEQIRKTRLEAIIAAIGTPTFREQLSGESRANLLLVPEMSELNELHDPDASAEELNTLWHLGWLALLNLCSTDEGRFALLDLPDDPSRARRLLGSTFPDDVQMRGAAWWPRIQTAYCHAGDPGKQITLTPIPAVAAVIQNGARNKGIWHPPANVALEKTLRPVRPAEDAPCAHNATMRNCNLIRGFIGKGVRLWGCRTLHDDDDSPFRYIQVRLLINWVRNQLHMRMRAYLFEPNTALTWTKIKGQVWHWLQQQWLEGSFFGKTEDEAFTLQIGLSETMTPDDVRAGKMILQVRLALLAPSEFVDISLTLNMRTGTNTLAGH